MVRYAINILHKFFFHWFWALYYFKSCFYFIWLYAVLQERTWYTPEAWEHGGLRLKEEVKDETDGSTPAKRVKKELKK